MMRRKKFGVSVKTRNEFNDFDYIEKLSDEDYDWLRRFQREYLNADFLHNGEAIHPSHLRKSCYDQNNQRNNDSYAIAKVQGKLYSMNDFGLDVNLEQFWIGAIDENNGSNCSQYNKQSETDIYRSTLSSLLGYGTWSERIDLRRKKDSSIAGSNGNRTKTELGN